MYRVSLSVLNANKSICYREAGSPACISRSKAEPSVSYNAVRVELPDITLSVPGLCLKHNRFGKTQAKVLNSGHSLVWCGWNNILRERDGVTIFQREKSSLLLLLWVVSS